MTDQQDEARHFYIGETAQNVTALARTLPGPGKALDKLTGSLSTARMAAQKARLALYRTRNFAKHAELVADNSGVPAPVVFNQRLAQRRLDELPIEAPSRLRDRGDPVTDTRGDESSDHWFYAFRWEAGLHGEADRREAFVCFLAEELKKLGSSSIRTLRAFGEMFRPLAEYFPLAVSVRILRETGVRDSSRCATYDARIPVLAGSSGLAEVGIADRLLATLSDEGLLRIEQATVSPNDPVSTGPVYARRPPHPPCRRRFATRTTCGPCGRPRDQPDPSRSPVSRPPSSVSSCSGSST